VRDERFFTSEGQRESIESNSAVTFAIIADGATVGGVTISDLVYGAFRSAHLGYWVAERLNGRGLAMPTVREKLSGTLSTWLVWSVIRSGRLKSGLALEVEPGIAGAGPAEPFAPDRDGLAGARDVDLAVVSVDLGEAVLVDVLGRPRGVVADLDGR
jgi:hypothetical protein